MEKVKIPLPVEQVMKQLENNGKKAYLVGGCLRDIALGKTPNDWDLATNGKPEEVKEVFKDFFLVETGIKHGTVTVVINSLSIEITTFRQEGDYEDQRHPNHIAFLDNVEEDLKRRDFTINSMAYHPKEGWIDPFGGRSDIEKGMIRCVGNPCRRLEEDSLRILRAVRFASVTGFPIEEETKTWMFALKERLMDISRERVREELIKTLMGEYAIPVLREYRELLAVFIAEIKDMFDLDQHNPYHKYDVYEHTLQVVSHVEKTKILCLAAFFHDIGKPKSMSIDEKGRGHFYGHEQIGSEMTNHILNRLKVDGKTKGKVVDLVKHHGVILRPERKFLKRWMIRLGQEGLENLIKLARADALGQGNVYVEARLENLKEVEEMMKQLVAEKAVLSRSELAITGTDLLELGVCQGREIGRILQKLLDMVVSEEIDNNREDLLLESELLKNKLNHKKPD